MLDKHPFFMSTVLDYSSLDSSKSVLLYKFATFYLTVPPTQMEAPSPTPWFLQVFIHNCAFLKKIVNRTHESESLLT
jgi:hypothetical protein